MKVRVRSGRVRCDQGEARALTWKATPITKGQNISPNEAHSCSVVIMRGDMVMPISAGSVTAAGKEEATPRPTPIAEDQSTACEGMDMAAAETTQHTCNHARTRAREGGRVSMGCRCLACSREARRFELPARAVLKKSAGHAEVT